MHSCSHAALDAATAQNYIDYDKANLTDTSTPEKILLRNERVQLLSHEAKTVINIIFDSPIEIFSFTGKITKQMLMKYLLSLGFTVKQITMTFNELKNFVKEL